MISQGWAWKFAGMRREIPAPMHHSGRSVALYLLFPSGVTRMASSKEALRVDIVEVLMVRSWRGNKRAG